MSKKAVIPGSFDPITNGHLDIIRRAAFLFDEVTVVICANSAKHSFLSPENRKKLVCDAVSQLSNVNVDITDGLFADYCAKNQIDIVVKGIRNSVDYSYEAELLKMNENIFLDKYGKAPETVFLQSEEKYVSHSSTFVRELIKYGENTERYVPNSNLLLSLLGK